jgi:hypothetical protein
MERHNLDSSHVSLLSPAVGTGNVGDHFIELAVRRLLRDDVVFHRVSTRRALSDGDVERINAADCALLCGTNLYQHDWECSLTPRALDRLQVPVIPFGVGGSSASLDDTHVSAATREMIRALHARCSMGSVRDPFSAAVVARAGVGNALLTGCPVLFWAGGDELPRVEPVHRRRVVLTARNWLMHRWPDNVDNPVQIGFLRKVMESFPPDDSVFAVHEEFDESLVSRLGIPEAQVVRGPDPERFLPLYTDPDNVVLALRLHAGMLALANGLPVVFVGHDTRTYSFCDMLNLEHVDLFSGDAAEACVERLRRILDGDVGAFDAAARSYRRLRGAMDTFLEANSLPARDAHAAAGPGGRR